MVRGQLGGYHSSSYCLLINADAMSGLTRWAYAVLGDGELSSVENQSQCLIKRVSVDLPSRAFEQIHLSDKATLRPLEDIPHLPFLRCVFYFADGRQFCSSVMGVDAASPRMVLIRKRPSRATSYCRVPTP